ncbi:hypothetical protein pdam_00016207 [Pocillopora damicornis]|uniref:Uncharacterized protein n=1 Tax=Pocillopora damicornis TaxID=46731 RepID=A0A3M6U0Y9_POCDA|nr:hypothetical protein pdam_00016207 [Pocillopora damicornis]
MAAKCVFRPSIASFRLCGSGALRCLERIHSCQRSLTQESNYFHSSDHTFHSPFVQSKNKKSMEERQSTSTYQDVEFECRIISVVHNTAHKDFNQEGVMVKGTIVEVDPSPFKTWYITHYQKEDSSQEANSSLEHLMPYPNKGKLYAKITSRPGQIGFCNGYILEGDELETLFSTREDLRPSSDKSAQGR